MKAETTPAPRLDFIRAPTLPYHTYSVLASRVPYELAPSWDKVNRTELSYGLGVPLETQSDFEESPKNSVFAVMPSRLSKVYFLSEQTGFGVQESRVWECIGSQPPRQKAPTPH